MDDLMLRRSTKLCTLDRSSTGFPNKAISRLKSSFEIFEAQAFSKTTVVVPDGGGQICLPPDRGR